MEKKENFKQAWEDAKARARAGDNLIKIAWYEKWNLLYKLGRAIMTIGVIICVGFVGLMIVVDWKDTKTIGSSSISAHQIWTRKSLDDKVYEAMINLNPEKGAIIWLGSTISREKALNVIVRQANRFNSLVDEKHQDYNAGFTVDINPAFRNAVDVYYVKDTDNTYGIFIVTSGTKIHDDSGVKYEKIM